MNKSPINQLSIHESGSVLILALWALFFLGALAVAVGSHVSGVLNVARYARSEMVTHLLAEAGMERAILEVVNNPTNWNGTDEDRFHSDESLFRENDDVEGGVFSVYYVYVSTNDAASVTNYGVICEANRLNINKAGHARLTAVFQERGGVTKSVAAEIAASIKDWRDKDDDALTGGAEDAYYRSLSEGYPCANGLFRRPEELLLVKGVTRDIFEAVSPYVTVYGATCFRGTAEGVVRAERGQRKARAPAMCRIEFVFETRGSPRIVYWRVR
jgi:general secretion pathway protein K